MDTPVEVEASSSSCHGGILPFVLRELLAGLQVAVLPLDLGERLSIVDSLDVGSGLSFADTYAPDTQAVTSTVLRTVRLPLRVGDEMEALDQKAVREAVAQIRSVLEALHVFKPGRCFPRGTYFGCRNRFVSVGRTGLLPSRLVALGRFDRLELGPEESEEFKTFFGLYDADAVRRRSFIGVAARRLQYSSERSRDEDRLIDLMIAAEALFLGENERQEFGFRLSPRAAQYLGSSHSERRAMYESFRDAYGLRSPIIHGSELNPAKLGPIAKCSKSGSAQPCVGRFAPRLRA